MKPLSQKWRLLECIQAFFEKVSWCQNCFLNFKFLTSADFLAISDLKIALTMILLPSLFKDNEELIFATTLVRNSRLSTLICLSVHRSSVHCPCPLICPLSSRLSTSLSSVHCPLVCPLASHLSTVRSSVHCPLICPLSAHLSTVLSSVH